MNTIPEWGHKIKLFTDDWLSRWGIVTLIFVLALGSFGLGRLSALEEAQPPVVIGEASLTATPTNLALGGLYVASRTGTVYYYPWCSGAQKIVPANQVWFQSEQAARAAGYAPSKSCKGLAE